MIPLRDHNPRRITPYVNYLLIAINVLFFIWEIQLAPNLDRALFRVAFIPARFWTSGYLLADLISIFVSMFLHGGLMHIAGNMLYLWIFGDNIEDRLGHGKYLVFYLLCGCFATLAHAFVNADSQVPAIGASGAIAGVLGAYLVLFPKARVTTLIPLFIIITIREIPAVFLLAFWFVIQLFTGVGSLGAAGDEAGVAYFAHIGGFIAGMVLVVVMGGLRRT